MAFPGECPRSSFYRHDCAGKSGAHEIHARNSGSPVRKIHETAFIRKSISARRAGLKR
jgi:hypothetical protein